MKIRRIRKNISDNNEGFLSNIKNWSKSVAEATATLENIFLTKNHWEVIYLLQQFYIEFDLSPSMRPLVKYIDLHLGKEKGNSIYLLTLFPPNPVKIASKIAGLPKPTNCL